MEKKFLFLISIILVLVLVSGCYQRIGPGTNPYKQDVDKDPDYLDENPEPDDANVDDIFADTDVEPPMMPN